MTAPRKPQPAKPNRRFHVLHAETPSDAGNAALAACGAKPYIFVSQNDDPNAATTGRIDTTRLVAAIKAKYGNNPTGFGMLDYEKPFDDWIGEGVGTEHHKIASGEMIGAIYAVRAAFPRVLWTYYGIPGLSYWPAGRLWATALPREQDNEKLRQIANYGPVLDACDWYSPCIYDVQENSTQRPQDAAINAENEFLYRAARIDVCNKHRKLFMRPERKIIPAVCPFYDSGGNVGDLRLIPEAEFLSDQISPCVAAADGVCIWAACGWMVKAATSPLDSLTRAMLRKCFAANIVIDFDTESAPAVLRDWCSLMLARYADLARKHGTKPATVASNSAV